MVPARGSIVQPMPEREVPISGESIRLGQLLKLAGVAGSGAEAKELLAGGAVRVNGEPEARRGRQLQRGDIVAVDGEPEQLRVA
jgi:ribosome-associated protein